MSLASALHFGRRLAARLALAVLVLATNVAPASLSSAQTTEDRIPTFANPGGLIQSPALPAPSIVEVRIAASLDDVEQHPSGSMENNSSDLEMTLEADVQTVGLRFPGLQIPQGSTITAAWIQFTVDETSSDLTALTIHGQASDNAPAFTSATNNLTSRLLTAASVSWAPNPWLTVGAAGADQRTPDLRTVIQEIVSRPGWQWQGALAIVISGSGKRTAEAFDGSPTQAPLLHVEFTASGPPPNMPPVAQLSVSVAASPALTVDASAAGSTDTDADPIATYTFSWGDGTANTVVNHPTVTASHTYAAAGTYTVTLTAADTGGLTSAPVTRSITLFPPGVSGFEARVAASADDAEESSTGSVNLTGTGLELTQDTSNQTVGMRWTGITVPQGAVITAAWVQFGARIADTQATTLAFWAEASNNATAFTTSTGNISSRPRSSVSVAWSPGAWAAGEAGPNQRTPDLKTIIQQVVSRSGWASGNALAIVVTGSGRRGAWAQNGNAALAPLLHIEYSTSGGPLPNSPPVANLGLTQDSAPAYTITANGAGSTDTDQNPIASYRFTWGDGTAATVTNHPTSSAKHTYAAIGTYTVTLQATDTGGLTSTVVSQSITLQPPPNAPPTAQLAVTQLASPAQTVQASAAGSTDPDTNPIASYRFDWGDGTAATVVNHPTVTATHTYAATGTYTVTLTATDTGGLTSAPVTRAITVLPAGVSAVEVRIATSSDDAEEPTGGSGDLSSSDLELTVDGSTNQTVGMRFPGLTIPAGATIQAAWIQFTSKQGDTQVTNLTFRGQAADNAPTFATTALNLSSRPVTGSSVNWSPASWATGEAGANQRTPDLKTVLQEIVSRPGWASGNALVLLVTGSGRRNAWSFNGNAAAAPLLHVEYSTGPPPPNNPPIASLTVTQVTEPALTVNASGAGSTDTDAFPIASYRFTFGDGSAPVIVNAPATATTHTYAAAGTYTVTLTATDVGGLTSAPVSLNVNVLPPPNQPPVANLTVTQAQTPPLTATASAAGSTDTDQEPIASYRFTWGDGSAATVINHPTLVASHTYAAAGTYTVTLTATDTGGLTSAPVTRSVTINPPVITTVEQRVAASADDAEQAPSGSVNITSSGLELTVNGSNNQVVGLRWTSFAIPQGATIQAAWIQFTARVANSGTCNLTFQGQADDAAATFTTGTNNVSSRARTTASAGWSPNAWASGAAGADQRTPDLKAIVQEIVNRPGWVSGNPLAMIVTGTGTRTAQSWNGSSAQAALLHVEYLGGSGSTNQPPVGQLAVAPAASPPLTATASAAGSSDPDSPIASYRFTWGDGTAATVVNHPTVTANHTYASAGTYTVTLVVTDAFGAQSTPVTQPVTVSTTPSQLAVYVGYYDTHHSSLLRPKPNPWQGSAGVTFVGTPDSPSGGWDTSAIRLDNLTGSPINVTVTVDMISHNFALWGQRTIPANGKLILAQTGFENFDGSDTSPAGCYDCNPNDCITKVESTIPVVRVTINGQTTNYYDVNQVMNTKGVDGAGCPYTGTRNDESSNWVQIGTNPSALNTEEAALIAAENRGGEPEVPVLALGAPYPNPASDGVVLRFSVAQRGRTQITLYDVAGRRVKSLLDWELAPGRYQQPTDLSSLKVGVYFLELKTPTGRLKTSLIVSR